MARPILHSDAIPVDEMVGQNILGENQFPMITDAQIQAATTYVDLKTAITNYAGHSETDGFKPGFKRSMDLGSATTSLSDANVQAATNAATLAANTFGTPGKVGPLNPV